MEKVKGIGVVFEFRDQMDRVDFPLSHTLLAGVLFILD